MGLVRANVTTWWESKLPAHVPHRRVLLDATVRMSQFWAASSQLFQSVPDCADLSTRCEAAAQVSGRYADLERWAAGLSHDAAGTVELAGGGRTGAHGAIKRWLLVEVGVLVRNHHVREWDLACAAWAPELPDCLSMSAVGAGMLTSVLPTAMVWPWLVDSCAIASAAGVRAVVPESVVYAPSSGAVVRLLMAGQQGAVAVEVGVDRGKTSEHLLQELPRLRLVGVDPYLGVYSGVLSSQRLNEMGSESAFRAASEVYSRFRGRAELRRVPSTTAARAWEEGPIDLVFIDGEHDFRSCRDDIRAWSGLVRPGGIVSGHDYHTNEEGVPRAVHGELPAGATLHLGPHGVWWWVKP